MKIHSDKVVSLEEFGAVKCKVNELNLKVKIMAYIIGGLVMVRVAEGIALGAYFLSN